MHLASNIIISNNKDLNRKTFRWRSISHVYLLLRQWLVRLEVADMEHKLFSYRVVFIDCWLKPALNAKTLLSVNVFDQLTDLKTKEPIVQKQKL